MAYDVTALCGNILSVRCSRIAKERRADGHRNDGRRWIYCPRGSDRKACSLVETGRSFRVLAVSGLAVGDRAGWARFDAGCGDSVHTRLATVARASRDRKATAASAALRLGSPSGGVSQGVRGNGWYGWRAEARSCCRVARKELDSARADENEHVLHRDAREERDSARADENEHVLHRDAREERDSAREDEDDAGSNGSSEEAVTCKRFRGYGFLRTGVCSPSASLLRLSRSCLKGLRPTQSVRAA